MRGLARVVNLFGVTKPPPPSTLLLSSRLRILGSGGAAILGDSDGTITNHNCVLVVYNETGATVTKIRAYFTNWRASNNGEVDGANAINVEASFEYPIGTTPQRFTFSAAALKNMAIGETIASDELVLNVPYVAGDPAKQRTYVSGLSAGQKYPMGYVVDTTAGEACDFNTGVSKVDGGTVTDTSTSTKRGFAPVALKATGFTGTPKSMAIIGWGDSIISGNDPSSVQNARGNTGYLGRGVAGKYPYVNWGLFSAAASDNKATITKRIALAQMIGATHIVCNYGRNDFTSDRTAAQLTADMATIWTQMQATGLKIIQATVTTRIRGVYPYTNNMGYMTQAGHQANPSPTGAEAERVAWNGYIRTKPSPLYAYYDAADAIETSRNSGIMKASESGHTRLAPIRNGAITATSTTTSLVTNLTSFSPSNWLSTGEGFVRFTSGANAGQVRTVSTTVSGTIGLDTALPTAPAIGDTFEAVSYYGAATTDGVHPSTGYLDQWGGQRVIADDVVSKCDSWI